MSKKNRPFPQTLLLAVAAALASASTWAADGAALTLASVSSSTAEATGVQDLGRIQVGAAYDAGVVRELRRLATHPDRFAAAPRRLNGKVDIDFEVNGDGTLSEARIAQSSSSNALDGAALRTVQRAKFQPVPAAAQSDGMPRRYVVTFDYRYPGTN